MGSYRFLKLITFMMLMFGKALASPGALPVAVVTCNASPIPTCISVNFSGPVIVVPSGTQTPTATPNPTQGPAMVATQQAIETQNYPAPLYYTPTPTFTPTSTPAYIFIQYSLVAESVTPTPVSTATAGHFHSLFLTISSNQASATNFILFTHGNAITIAGNANGPVQLFVPDYIGNKSISITGMTGNTTVNLSGWMVDTVFPPHPQLGFPCP